MTLLNDVIHDEKYKKCLDKGFVGLVDYMGSDQAIVQAARVSYGSGTKSVRQDRGLIRYLVSHRHTSPIEQCQAKFHMKMPILVARQWIRHRTASLNEYSARYSILHDEFYIPEPDVMQNQSSTNKQGREDAGLPDELKEEMINRIDQHSKDSYKLYEYLLGNEEENGLARELARMVLPVNIYTEWFWTANLHNILHLLNLRMDSHAQYEIRVFANAMYALLLPLFPMTIDAFDDYVRYAVNVSKMEKNLLRDLLEINGEKSEKLPILISRYGSLDQLQESYDLTKREFTAFCNQWGFELNGLG